MAPLEPFTLIPILDERPWGGDRLAAYGKDVERGASIGESWEVADLPRHVAPYLDTTSNMVASGSFAGTQLHDIVERTGADLLGSVPPTSDGRFPLLFKLLDVHEHLSVQVHPPADYVAAHPSARLKTESWFVVEADEDAVLYLDLVDGVTIDDVEVALGSNAIVPLLRSLPVRAGSFHHVPAGLVHTIGPGIIIAEVQTPSDTTFRLYDWAVEYDRAPRTLHIDEGLASIRIRPDDAFHLEPAHAPGSRTLIECPHYVVREHRTDRGVEVGDGDSAVVVHVTEGGASIGDLALGKGTTAIVPASTGSVHIDSDGPSTVLEMAPR